MSCLFNWRLTTEDGVVKHLKEDVTEKIDSGRKRFNVIKILLTILESQKQEIRKNEGGRC